MSGHDERRGAKPGADDEGPAANAARAPAVADPRAARSAAGAQGVPPIDPMRARDRALNASGGTAARSRKLKPPPGIITAGGVDMARAHASNIQVRDGGPAAPTAGEPRVVVAVETDPRKVPTHKRLLEGRDASDDGSRVALLPGVGGDGAPWKGRTAEGASAARPSSDAANANTKASERPTILQPLRPDGAQTSLPRWMRVAFVVVLLVLMIGVGRRIRSHFGSSSIEETAVAPPHPAMPAAPTASPAPPAPVEPAHAAPVVTATAAVLPQANDVREPAPAEEHKRPSTPEPRHPNKPAAAPPKPTFTPPFQLPGEKN